VSARLHPLCRLLRNEKGTESIYSDAPLYGRRVQISQPSGHAGAGVVDDDVGLAEQALGVEEQLCHSRGVGGVYGENLCTGLTGQSLEFLDIASSQANRHTKRRQTTRE
jgi:hypothetical protein